MTSTAVPTAPAKPRKKVYLPIEVPVYTAGIGDVYMHNQRRGEIVAIEKGRLSRYDRTHVTFAVKFDGVKEPQMFRHDVISTFETAAVVEAADAALGD